jgi:hypothetical protein
VEIFFMTIGHLYRSRSETSLALESRRTAGDMRAFSRMGKWASDSSDLLILPESGNPYVLSKK